MATPAKMTKQFAFVGPEIMYDMVKATADAVPTDKAVIVRRAMDMLYGTVGCELVEGDTAEAAVERAVAILTSATAVQDEPIV